MNDRGITPMELFRTCDVSNDGSLNIKELEQVLKGFSAEFYQKDTQAIHNFFDIDKNGSCSEAEFISQLQKAERLLQQHKDRMQGNKPGTAGTFRGNKSLNDRDVGIDMYIPRFNESSPQIQTEMLTEFMVNEFQQKSLQPMRIFNMANTRQSDTIRFGNVLDAMQKAMPHIPREIVELIPDAYQLDIND